MPAYSYADSEYFPLKRFSISGFRPPDDSSFPISFTSPEANRFSTRREHVDLLKPVSRAIFDRETGP